MKKLKCLSFLAIITISSLIFLPSRPEQVKIEANELEFQSTGLKSSKTYVNEWYEIFGGDLDDVLRDACCDEQGNIYAIGSNGSATLIVMFNATGSLLWNVTWGTSSGDSITIDPDGNLYCTTTNSTGFNIHKFNTSRELEWTRKWGTYSSDQAHDIALDSLGYLYVVGQAYSSGATELLLLKYDENGTMKWERTWDASAAYDIGFGIDVNDFDAIFVVGKSSDKMCIAKYSTSGNRIIEKVFSLHGAAFSVVANSSGVSFVLGHDDDHSIPFLMKLSNVFGMDWRLNLSFANLYNGNYELVSHSDVLYACANGQGEFKLYQVSMLGSLVGEQGWDAPFCNYATKGLGLCMDKHQNLYVPGSVEYCGSGPNDDAILVKFGNDTDNDGLTNYQEVNTYSTDPNDADTDGDHWTDGEEVLTHSTDPLTPNKPAITIYSPLTAYNESLAPKFSVHVDAIANHSRWYSLDNDTTRTFFTSTSETINAMEWNKRKNGAVKIEFYANDTRGNVGRAEVIVQKYVDVKSDENSDDDDDNGKESTEPPWTVASYPFEMFFLIGITFYIIVIRKQLKKYKIQC